MRVPRGGRGCSVADLHVVDRTLALDSGQFLPWAWMDVHHTELLPSAFLLWDLATSHTPTLPPHSLLQLTMPKGQCFYHRSFPFLYLGLLHLELLNAARCVSDLGKNVAPSIKLSLNSHVSSHPVVSLVTCVPSRNYLGCALASICA